ncbi:MAG: FMN-binding glutamate synthase family protein, partial [Candidatus Nealsonbacteria bacterium CG02_land_8_20_14_3_00_37_10]
MDQDWIRKIQDRTKRIPISSGRSNKFGKFGFDDLVFVPAQLAKRPVDYFMEEISSKTIIGKNSKKPIVLETPIIIGAMSFGALSKEAKIALAKASTMAGTMENTGEGGVLPEEREFSRRLIIQYSTGRFGITEEILKKADAVEIKIGQGAKPGQGGLLPKEKITEEIAQIRNVPVGKDIH